MKRTTATIVLVSVLGASLPRVALCQRAADVAEARDLFREGSTLAEQGKWDEARDRFLRSLALKRAALTLYSLGVAQKNTGHYVDALESFRAFLVEPSTPTTQPFELPAQQAIQELEPKVARVTLKIDPADVSELDVRIDEIPVPSEGLGAPRLLDPGKHVILVAARSYVPAKREVELSGGSNATIALQLLHDDNPIPPGAPVPYAPPGEAPPKRESPPPQRERSRIMPFALVAGGGALILTGTAIGLLGVKQAHDASSKSGGEADSAHSKAIAGDVLAGVGIVAAAVGVVWLVTMPKEKKVAGTEIVVGPTGAWVRGRF